MVLKGWEYFPCEEKLKETFFHCGVTEHWHKLLTEVVESPSLGLFKSCLDMVLHNLLQVILFKQQIVEDDFCRGSLTTILWFCDSEKSKELYFNYTKFLKRYLGNNPIKKEIQQSVFELTTESLTIESKLVKHIDYQEG